MKKKILREIEWNRNSSNGMKENRIRDIVSFFAVSLRFPCGFLAVLFAAWKQIKQKNFLRMLQKVISKFSNQKDKERNENHVIYWNIPKTKEW